jgi:pimeloyl-ACP methyl ester carboxylesterase
MAGIITLSGWGQPHDALSDLLPGSTPLGYAKEASVQTALQRIAQAGAGADLVAGWSLGGQMAVRAIAEKRFRPKALLLIGAAFQFVESQELKLGLKHDQFDKFLGNYERNPERTLTKGWELITKGDDRNEQVRAILAAQDKAEILSADWLTWLRSLEDFTCRNFTLADFPPTLIVHGKGDVVVDCAQSDAFAKAIPHGVLSQWEHTGHAPHWHDPARLRALVEEHLHV